MRTYNYLMARYWAPVFDDAGASDPGDPGDPGAGGAGDTGDKGGDKGNGVFTQDQVDKIIAERLDRQKKQYSTAISELEALKAKSQLTAKERKDLEERIETMRSELLTKEEIAEQEKTKIQRKYKEDVDRLGSERDSWLKRYTDSTIIRSITDAAMSNEAFSPEQIVALLQNKTSLVEALDSEGKPSGELIPKVKFTDADKDGKPVTLDLTVGEAVKRMTEIGRYFNLFKGKGTGGAGATNTAGAGGVDIERLKKDPVAYRKARAEGKL